MNESLVLTKSEIEDNLDCLILKESHVEGNLIVLSDKDYGNLSEMRMDWCSDYTIMSLSEYKEEYK